MKWNRRKKNSRHSMQRKKISDLNNSICADILSLIFFFSLLFIFCFFAAVAAAAITLIQLIYSNPYTRTNIFIYVYMHVKYSMVWYSCALPHCAAAAAITLTFGVCAVWIRFSSACEYFQFIPTLLKMASLHWNSV